jgi:hypothetical protein
VPHLERVWRRQWWFRGATGLYSKILNFESIEIEKLLPWKPRRKSDDPENYERLQVSRRKVFLAKDRFHNSPASWCRK